ncbi:unnamed protein product [Lactuca saligna]|uniref:Uncharacterized protein n=1 Tax=Lactuca saligna TaxID=75948 RepID=A0AA35VFU5_LACSI|nr:unnamed protein product [Lactuca saligna]
MLPCFDYSSDDTEDEDQYGDEALNYNEYDDDDFYHSDDQYSGRNQLSDYASEDRCTGVPRCTLFLKFNTMLIKFDNHW